MIQENVAVGVIPDYFDKYYEVAVNVYCFSTAIAIIVSPSLTSWFLDIYGWRGALLLLCGINIQSVVFGALVPQGSPSNGESEERRRLLQTTGISNQESCEYSSLRDVLQKCIQIVSFQLLKSLPFITRVVLPGIINGYTMSSWMIYIISFALSKGASMRESSIVATWGGVGVAIIRMALPSLNKYFAYRTLMYIASIVMACSLAATTFVHSVIGMSSTSFIFGMTYGVLGTEIYVAVKDVIEKDQFLNAVSWFHLAFGFGASTGGSLTGIGYSLNGTINVRLRQDGESSDVTTNQKFA